MSDKPLISVIVPVYNSGEFIERCLKSLAAQTYDNIEIITADDGSADDSGEICRGFAGSDRRFRYIRRENSGVAAARNGGLSEARGELIGFCDSDDHIEPEMFEYLAELIERYNADISQCGAMIEFEDKPSREFKPESDILIEDFKNADKNALKLYHNAVWCKLFRRETIDGVKFESAFPIGEDLLFGARAALNARKIALGSRALYHYVQRETSVCYKKPTPKTLGSMREAIKAAVELFPEGTAREFYFDSGLRNDFDICSKYVRFCDNSPEFSGIISEARRELRDNLQYIKSGDFTDKEKLKARLAAKHWRLYSALIRRKRGS